MNALTKDNATLSMWTWGEDEDISFYVQQVTLNGKKVYEYGTHSRDDDGDNEGFSPMDTYFDTFEEALKAINEYKEFVEAA
jgi:hypothetical protein